MTTAPGDPVTGTGRTGRVHVLVYASAPDGSPDAVAAAYHTISDLLAGTPGLLGNVLLRSVHDPSSFVVMSEWRDMAAFQKWEEGADHRGSTAPLRPFQDPSARGGSAFGIYEVTAAY